MVIRNMFQGSHSESQENGEIVRRAQLAQTGQPRMIERRHSSSASRDLEPLSLGQVFQPLRRRWLMVAGLTAFCGLAALLFSLHQTPVYQATALLEVQGFNEDFLNMKNLEVTTSDHLLAPYLATQILVLQSPDMLARVAN